MSAVQDRNLTATQLRYIECSEEANQRYTRSNWALGISFAILTTIAAAGFQNKYEARPLTNKITPAFLDVALIGLITLVAVVAMLLKTKTPPYTHSASASDCTSLKKLDSFKSFYDTFPKTLLPWNKFNVLFDYGLINRSHRGPLNRLYLEFETHPDHLPSIEVTFQPLLPQIQSDLPNPLALDSPIVNI